MPTQANPARPSLQSDVLTEQEKEAAVAYETNRLIEHYAYRMKEKGLHPGDIAARISQIDWPSMVDTQSVIDGANSRKLRALEEQSRVEERKERIKYEQEQLKIQCNAKYFFKLIKHYFETVHGRFDTTNMEYIKAVCFFFSADLRFESELGFSFNKGLLIQGTAGLGKTKTIIAIKDNPLYPVKVFSMIDITQHVRDTGSCEINTQQMILLDDVGSETELVKHYGNQINWFKEFIESYYLCYTSYSGLLITTNCGGDELEQKYGYRVRSRIREMFNVITLIGNDQRK